MASVNFAFGCYGNIICGFFIKLAFDPYVRIFMTSANDATYSCVPSIDKVL